MLVYDFRIFFYRENGAKYKRSPCMCETGTLQSKRFGNVYGRGEKACYIDDDEAFVSPFHYLLHVIFLHQSI